MAFTYNGTHSDAMGVTVMGIRRDFLPPITPRTITVPGRPGSYWYGHDYGAREITIDVFVRGTSLADLRIKLRNIANWLKPDGGPKPLVFDDEPDKQYFAVLADRTELEQILWHGRGTLTFVCPDPYAYGELEQAQFIITENDQSVTLENAGNTSTPVQLVIKNQGDTPINGFTLICYKIE